MASIDLEAYLQRVGYAGPRAPTLDTLRAIQLRHTEIIPFENFNPLLSWPVRLDVESLQQKMVRGGRGGYCYEQNLLFKSALEALGYKVVGLAARVLWNAAMAGPVTPRTHMLLRIELGGQSWLADVGFGVMTPTGPLRLEPDIEQATPHEPYRMVHADDEFIMQAKIRGEWKALYRFSLQEQLLPDYEMANWYVSTHPDSRFVNGLMVARPVPGKRRTLLNNELTVHRLDGDSEKRVLASAAELRQVLESDFRLTLPDAPELDAVLRRLTS